jgi:hypothetical protein
VAKKTCKLDISGGAAVIQQAADRAELSHIASVKAAKKLSDDPSFNLAAFLKYDLPSMDGMEDNDWVYLVKDIQTILGGRK